MKNYLLSGLFLLLLTTANSLAGEYPEIKEGRPRIYLDSSRFAKLRVYRDNNEEFTKTYNDFIYAYNGWWINDPQLYIEGSDSTKWTWDWASQWAKDEAVFTAFLYRLNNDTLAAKRCRFIAGRFVNHIDTVDLSAMDWYEKETLLRQMSDIGGILLDWAYPALGASLRIALTRSMYAMQREFMNTYILSAAGTSYVSSHNAWNCVFTNQNSLVLFNSEGLDSLQKDTVVQWYQTVYDKWINGFLPCYGYFRDDDGGWNWGAAYSMWSLVDQFQLFENMRIATGRDFYRDLPWVLNSINQYIYFIQPDGKSLHLGDGHTSIGADRVIYRHAAIFRDPRSLWMAWKYSQEKYITSTMMRFAKIIYKDFEAPVPEFPDIPLDWFADKTGLSVSYSGWDTAATMVSFFNSPVKRAAHEHRDNNSFAIFKYAPLLIDAGHYDAYGTSHYNNYYSRTIAHNNVCVHDSAGKFYLYGNPVSNDGGQVESRALQNYSEILQPENRRGQWIRYACGKDWCYNAADAGLSYDTSRLDMFARRLLYIKPDDIIVLDHIHLKNRETAQRDVKWTAHFANMPEIDGEILKTEVQGHVEYFESGNYCAENGRGRISLKTLLPGRATAARIGGKGYEYMVDGVNYELNAAYDTAYYTPGRWRLEISPDVPSDSIIFLHWIKVGDTADKAEINAVCRTNSSTISIEKGGVVYLFPAAGDTGRVYYRADSIEGGRPVDIFALDMSPGQYEIFIDYVKADEIRIDTNGIARARLSLGDGRHMAELAMKTLGIGETDGRHGGKFCLNPNPAGNVLNIITGYDEGMPVRVVIYNMHGVEAASAWINGTGILDIDRLPAGVYSVLITSANKTEVIKFVKIN